MELCQSIIIEERKYSSSHELIRGLSVGFKDFQSKNVPGKSRVDTTMVDSCCFFMDMTGVDLYHLFFFFSAQSTLSSANPLFLLSTWNTCTSCLCCQRFPCNARRASCMKKEDDFDNNMAVYCCFRQTKRRFLEAGWCIGTSILWFGRWFTSFLWICWICCCDDGSSPIS